MSPSTLRHTPRDDANAQPRKRLIELAGQHRRHGYRMLHGAAHRRLPEQITRGRAQDRARVAGGRKHEVSYEGKKTGTSPSEVRGAVKKAGNSRGKAEADPRPTRRLPAVRSAQLVKHGSSALPPRTFGQVFLERSERNSRRRPEFLRNAPCITLFVVIDSSSLTPRQCMQKWSARRRDEEADGLRRRARIARDWSA